MSQSTIGIVKGPRALTRFGIITGISFLIMAILPFIVLAAVVVLIRSELEGWLTIQRRG